MSPPRRKPRSAIAPYERFEQPRLFDAGGREGGMPPPLSFAARIHSDVKIAMIYAHLSSDYLAEQIDRVKF